MESLVQRVLEPEYMDTVDEANGYDTMDHTSANESVARAFQEAGGGRGLTLDIGTGPGHLPLMLAQSHPDGRFVALDAAHEMLKLARRYVLDAGMADRVQLHMGDAKQLPYADDTFDGVFSNTILHHIPTPVDLLREAYRVLRTDGVLLIRDLFRPYDKNAAWALVDEHAADATKQQRQLLFDSLHASLTVSEAKAATQEAGMQGVRVEQTSDRHYTILCHKP